MPSSILNRSQLRFIWALCLTFIIIHHFHMTALLYREHNCYPQYARLLPSSLSETRMLDSVGDL